MKAAIRFFALALIVTSVWLGHRALVVGASRIERRAPTTIARFLGAEAGSATSCEWRWALTSNLTCRNLKLHWADGVDAQVSQTRIIFHPWDAFTGNAAWSAQLEEITSAVAAPEKLLGNLVLLWPNTIHGRLEWNGLAGVPGRYSLEMGPGKESELLEFKLKGEGAWSQFDSKLLVVGAWRAMGTLRRNSQEVVASVSIDGADSEIRWSESLLHKATGVPLRLLVELRGSQQEIAVDHLSFESEDLTMRGAGIVRREGAVVQMHLQGASLPVLSMGRWFPSLIRSTEWSWMGGLLDLEAQLEGSAGSLDLKVTGVGRDLALQGKLTTEEDEQKVSKKIVGMIEATWEKGTWAERKVDLRFGDQTQISLSESTACGDVREWCVVSSRDSTPSASGRMGIGNDGPYLLWDHDELRIRPAGPRR